MEQTERLYRTLKKSLGSRVRLNQPLASFTSLRIGGPASLFAEVDNYSELRVVLKAAKESNFPFFILGRGSNILVSDQGYQGLVVRLGKDFRRLIIDGETVQAGAAVPMVEIVRLAQVNGLAGLSFAVGIPGSFGGALYMNAGAFGQSIGELVTKVKLLQPELELVSLSRDEIEFGYRFSSLHGVILEGELRLKKGDADKIKVEMERYFKRRKQTQPLALPNAGSIFRNPLHQSAARLIELVGAKGWQKGGAQVSPHHANFIVNLGEAKASDVYWLICEVKSRVAEAFGIELEPEIKLLGFGNGETG